MIDEEVIRKLKEKYSEVHPLLFCRTVERARSAGDLFDIMEALPNDLPIMWSEDSRRWVVTDDLSQSANFQLEE